MGLTCNIDRRGRRLRGALGGLLLLGSLGLAVGAWLTGRHAALGLPSGVLMVLGLFGIFEGLNGWCAVRAMGFKTPI